MKQLMKSITQNSFWCSFLWLMSFSAYSQDTLKYQDFLDLVVQFHPRSESARLQKQQGDLAVRSAKGSFDPVAQAKMKEKFFQEKYYYTLFDAGVSLPTITGLTLDAGLTNNGGTTFLNAEDFTPEGGTGYLGVTIPLGKGLFIDENRAQLAMAKQQREQFEAMSALTQNDLNLEAALAYWYWYQAYYQLEALKNALVIAEERLSYVVSTFEVGESAMIDTVKAFVQKQEIQQANLKGFQNQQNAHWKLMSFIWSDSLFLKQGLIPEPFTVEQIQQVLNEMQEVDASNPNLRFYLAKIKEANVSRRLKADKLKPMLDFNYSLLTNSVIPDFNGFGNSQVWGLGFKLPLFLRTERADLKLAKIKVEQLNNDFDEKQRELNMKLNAQLYELSNLNVQLDVLQKSLTAYEQLLSAERTKFEMGESTLFELNMWEQKLLETQLKYIETYTKLNTGVAKLNSIRVNWN